ncbi:hypothetical protein JW777_08865, partial [bacterium]|nr:hypothetical protein [bacterium]
NFNDGTGLARISNGSVYSDLRIPKFTYCDIQPKGIPERFIPVIRMIRVGGRGSMIRFMQFQRFNCV